jgi:putative protease
MPKKKKKVKKIVKKAKKAVKKKIVKAKKSAKKIIRSKAKVARKGKAVNAPKEKLLGRVEHFFDKISVAAIGVKASFAVGDVLHFKGHTTDFVQKVDSMQIEHQSVIKVKKGDDIGIKVKDFVREHDLVYLGNEKDLSARPVQPIQTKPIVKPLFQTSIFERDKPIAQPAAKPQPSAQTAPPAKKPEKKDPYSNTKFFNF